MEILIYSPLVIAFLVLAVRRRMFSRVMLLGWSFFQCAFVIAMMAVPSLQKSFFEGTAKYFAVDPLNSIFLVTTAVLFVASAVHSIHFLKHSEKRWDTLYIFYLILFVFAIDGVLLSRNLAGLWVFIEATTLAGALLIYYEKTHASIEAAWKYIFICSIGIAFAFMGIIFLSVASGDGGGLFFEELYAAAPTMSPVWLKFGFAFAMIGFGVKMGLAPVHSWLPDAHSEAPSPVSALLSGALLNGAFLAILRISKIAALAGNGLFSKQLMIVMGVMSVFVAAVFMQKVHNYKRMLAYSSIENMGIMIIGSALGGMGLFAALLHSIAHSLVKSSLFLTAGNIYHKYGSKSIAHVSALFRTDVRSAALWAAGFFCIVGTPPCVTFVSEFLVVKAMFAERHYFLAAVFLILLAAVLYGMGFAFMKMLAGEKGGSFSEQNAPWYCHAPQAVFIAASVAMGVYMPSSLVNFLNAAVGEIAVK